MNDVGARLSSVRNVYLDCDIEMCMVLLKAHCLLLSDSVSLGDWLFVLVVCRSLLSLFISWPVLTASYCNVKKRVLIHMLQLLHFRSILVCAQCASHRISVNRSHSTRDQDIVAWKCSRRRLSTERQLTTYVCLRLQCRYSCRLSYS